MPKQFEALLDSILHPDEIQSAWPALKRDELPPLEYLIQRENLFDILHALRSRERTIAILRLEGLSDAQIARLLRVSRTTPTRVMARAQQRILHDLPQAAGLLAGRYFEPSLHPPAGPLLEKGWICDWSVGDDWPDPDDDRDHSDAIDSDSDAGKRHPGVENGHLAVDEHHPGLPHRRAQTKERESMPANKNKTRCTCTTAQGQPCRAWAVRGSCPPTCSAHAGLNIGAGPPAENQNARTHGFYSRAFRPDEITDLVTYAKDLNLDDEIACARVALRRILILLDSRSFADAETPADTQPLDPDDYARLMGLALQATRTVARLLRDKRALSGDAADGLLGALSTALDELSTEWNVDL